MNKGLIRQSVTAIKKNALERFVAITSIFIDTVFFAGWLLIAKVTSWLTKIIPVEESDEIAFFVFQWTSTISILAVVLSFLIQDLFQIYLSTYTEIKNKKNR